MRKLEVSTLGENAAAQFLLDRTHADRSKSKDDATLARTLARELGSLALGLEQAGAHITTDRIGFARYLKLWNESREKLFAWSDPTLTGSEKTLATTWATSVARLPPQSVRLLDRLAMLAPDPIPDSLLDVAVPGEDAGYDTQKARAGLFAYSLIARAKGEDGQGFVIHRLVQDFARRAMTMERRNAALREALAWVNAAFVGHPQDVRTWPILDPLAPHAFVVARHAHAAGIAEPTGRLFNELAQLSHAKARFAEPLMRRALALREKSYGPDHPNVGQALNNLAMLLLATKRRDEAKPLLRRALPVLETSLGVDLRTPWARAVTLPRSRPCTRKAHERDGGKPSFDRVGRRPDCDIADAAGVSRQVKRRPP